MVLSELDPFWLLAIGIIVGAAFASALWAWRYNIKIRSAFEEGLTQDADKNTAERRLLDERLDITLSVEELDDLNSIEVLLDVLRKHDALTE